jgi:hypothetical protein
MSTDGAYSAVHQRKVLLDIVDDEWARDVLSDDDIEIPADVVTELGALKKKKRASVRKHISFKSSVFVVCLSSLLLR